MKKKISVLLALVLTTGALAGCGGGAAESSSQAGVPEPSVASTASVAASDEAPAEAALSEESTAAASGYINVISREDGSGTRVRLSSCSEFCRTMWPRPPRRPRSSAAPLLL